MTLFLTLSCAGGVRGTSLLFLIRSPTWQSHLDSLRRKTSPGWGEMLVVWGGALCPLSYLLPSFWLSHFPPAMVLFCGLLWQYLKKKKNGNMGLVYSCEL